MAKDFYTQIQEAVASGDYVLAAQLEQGRNQKIDDAGDAGITWTGSDGKEYRAEKTNDYSQWLNPNFDPNTDYYTKAKNLYEVGDYSGAYDALFGGSNSRNAKIAGTGNDHGMSSESIWELLKQTYGGAGSEDDDLRKRLELLLGQAENGAGSYGGNGNYDTAQAIVDKLNSMQYEDWTKSDQYKALADRYGRTGSLTMQDVLGQIASRTGGLASSYAETAAQQQYNDFMARLEEVARQQYGAERGEMMENAKLALEMGDRDYQRYLDELAQGNEDRSYALKAIIELLGMNDTAYNRGVYDDETAYNRGQTARAEAQNRIYDYLVNQGGSVGDLDPELITASGLTTAELNAMEAKYQEGAAAAAGKGGSGGGSGGGNGEFDYAGLFAAAKASGNPQSWLSQKANYSKYGFTSSAGLYEDYKNWLKAQENPGDGSLNDLVGVLDLGLGPISYQKVEELVEKGDVMAYATADGKVRVMWMPGKGPQAGTPDTGDAGDTGAADDWMHRRPR